MPNELSDLARLLERRLEVISDHAWRDRDADAHLDALREVSLKIVALHESLRPSLPPRLEHFMAGCSYDKALGFIRESVGLDTEN